MGKTRILSGREVCRILSRHGFVETRRRGSHVIMKKLSPPTITIPIPDHKELRMGTLRSIISQSGLPAREFES